MNRFVKLIGPAIGIMAMVGVLAKGAYTLLRDTVFRPTNRNNHL